MKKNLLLIAGLMLTASLSAQTVTWTCASNDATTYPTASTGPTTVFAIPDAVVSGSTTITGTAKFTSTTGILGLQTTYKDASQAKQYMFPDDQTKGYIKFGSVADKTNPKTNYVDFTVEQTEASANLNLQSITFNITRLGTDNIRNNFELITDNGNGDVESGDILTKDNWKTYANGESWKDDADATTGEVYSSAYCAIREDLSKATNVDGLKVPYNTVTIPVTSLTGWDATNYKVTLRVYAWGGGVNKSFLVDNVVFNCGTASGINEVNTANASKNAAIYNLAGQRVSKAVKGIYIQNGKKFIAK